VEIVPGCIVVPAGWRVALSVRGKDYEYTGELSGFAKKFHYATRPRLRVCVAPIERADSTRAGARSCTSGERTSSEWVVNAPMRSPVRRRQWL
jgi:hypothetical protein